MSIFYRPPDSTVADVIPFFWKGDYHLFYLRDWRDPARFGEGTPWWHIVTRDFVHFEDWGQALPRGTEQEQDLYVYTGCVFEHAGTFHIFYTGHNPVLRKAGKPLQAVMHATSPDLRTWTKHPKDSFLAPAQVPPEAVREAIPGAIPQTSPAATGEASATWGYEPDDWRDPFIYFDERYGEFAMLLAARLTSGPGRQRGSTALLTSPDLKTWTPRKPFWAPGAFFTHECPDLFRAGEWWYLIFSEFSDRRLTRYRMARSLDGPWLAPSHPDGRDSFDARAFYAAKSASDGKDRYLFGWLPTRKDDQDDTNWQWGGDLVVHQVVPRADGTLQTKPPQTVLDAFGPKQAISPVPRVGPWQVDGETGVGTDATGCWTMLTLGPMPDECLIEAQVKFTPGVSGAGLLLRADAALDNYYQVRLEPLAQRVVIDRWPRPGDQPFIVEQPVSLRANHPVRLRVLVSGTCLVVYVDDRAALSCRMYQHRVGQWGLVAMDGPVEFTGLSLQTRQ